MSYLPDDGFLLIRNLLRYIIHYKEDFWLSVIIRLCSLITTEYESIGLFFHTDVLF